MKKVFAVIAALVLAVPSFAQYSSGGFDLDKENLYYGVRIGMTGATLSGDAVEVKDLGSKVGLTLAGIIGLHISKTAPVFLESGLYYTERGAKKDKFSISYNNLEIVGITLKTRPFTRGHLSYSLFIDFTFYVGCRYEIFLSEIKDEVAFSTHTATNNRICNRIVINYFISKSMTCGFMTCSVPSQRFYICF